MVFLLAESWGAMECLMPEAESTCVSLCVCSISLWRIQTWELHANDLIDPYHFPKAPPLCTVTRLHFHSLITKGWLWDLNSWMSSGIKSYSNCSSPLLFISYPPSIFRCSQGRLWSSSACGQQGIHQRSVQQPCRDCTEARFFPVLWDHGTFSVLARPLRSAEYSTQKPMLTFFPTTT